MTNAKIGRVPGVAATAVRPLVHPNWLAASNRPVAGSIFAGLWGQSVLVMTGVVVARALGPTDRGHLAFILLLESVVRQVGGLGLSSGLTFFIARNRGAAHELIRRVRTPVLLQAALLTIVQAVLLWIFVSDDPSRVWLAGLITLALVPSILGQEYGLAILQGQGHFSAFNVLRALPITAYGVMIAILYATEAGGLIGITTAYLAANVVFAVVIVWVAVRGARSSGRHETVPSLREIFGYGARGYLGGLSPVETFRLDQAAIGLFLAPAALGLYVVGLSFTNLPRFIAGSVGAIAFPRAAHAHDGTGRRTMWRFTFFVAAISAAVVLSLELAAGWLVPFFFGSEFNESIGVTRVLLIGAFFLSVRRVLTDGAKGIGFPGLGSIAELGSWLSLVPLLAILMPRFGLQGVAAAIAISSGLSLAILMVALLRTSRGIYAERLLPEPVSLVADRSLD